jgi:hypothetical protein
MMISFLVSSSRRLIRPVPLALFFGAGFGCCTAQDSASCTGWVTPELKKRHLVITATAGAFLALKSKNIPAELIQIESQIGDYIVFF